MGGAVWRVTIKPIQHVKSPGWQFSPEKNGAFQRGSKIVVTGWDSRTPPKSSGHPHQTPRDPLKPSGASSGPPQPAAPLSDPFSRERERRVLVVYAFPWGCGSSSAGCRTPGRANRKSNENQWFFDGLAAGLMSAVVTDVCY